jgi:hypothetical protein
MAGQNKSLYAVLLVVGAVCFFVAGWLFGRTRRYAAHKVKVGSGGVAQLQEAASVAAANARDAYRQAWH